MDSDVYIRFMSRTLGAVGHIDREQKQAKQQLIPRFAGLVRFVRLRKTLKASVSDHGFMFFATSGSLLVDKVEFLVEGSKSACDIL